MSFTGFKRYGLAVPMEMAKDPQWRTEMTYKRWKNQTWNADEVLCYMQEVVHTNGDVSVITHAHARAKPCDKCNQS